MKNIYYIGLIFYFFTASSAMPQFLERDLNFLPFLKFQDKKLENYAVSYFNVISTFSGGNVSQGDLANFVMIEDKNIYAHGTLVKDRLLSYGISESVADRIIGLYEFSSGCGTYILIGESNKLTYSLSIIDGSQDFQKKVSCVNQSFARSFGILKNNPFKNVISYLPGSLLFTYASSSCRSNEDFEACVAAISKILIDDISSVLGAGNE